MAIRMNPLEKHIALALQKGQGSKTLAKKYLIEAALNDAQLLKMMTGPFLESISLNMLDRFMRNKGIVDNVNAVEEEKPAPRSREDTPPTPASVDHRSAVMQMVAAFQAKKKQ